VRPARVAQISEVVNDLPLVPSPEHQRSVGVDRDPHTFRHDRATGTRADVCDIGSINHLWAAQPRQSESRLKDKAVLRDVQVDERKGEVHKIARLKPADVRTLDHKVADFVPAHPSHHDPTLWLARSDPTRTGINSLTCRCRCRRLRVTGCEKARRDVARWVVTAGAEAQPSEAEYPRRPRAQSAAVAATVRRSRPSRARRPSSPPQDSTSGARTTPPTCRRRRGSPPPGSQRSSTDT